MKTGLLLIILIIGYAIGFVYDPFLFLPLALLPLYVIALFGIFLGAINIILRCLPPDAAKNYGKNKRQYKIIIFIYSALLFFGTWAINRYFLPHKLHPVSLAADGALLTFTVFLAWALLTARNRKLIFTGVLAFIVLISSLSYVGTTKYRHVEPSSLDAIKSLPYLSWVPAEKSQGKIGVTRYEPSLSYKGFNIFTYDRGTTAYLMGMSGRIVHEWSSGIYKLHHVEPYADGGVLGIAEDEGLIKLDFDSNIVWEKNRRFHHDVSIAENGDIYAIARKDRIVFKWGLPLPVLDDYILLLSADGDVKERISFYEVLKKEIPLSTVAGIYGWMIRPHVLMEMLINKKNKGFAFDGWFRCAADIFHVNTVEIIKRPVYGLCKKGDLLVCVRNLDLIGILDIEKRKLAWGWGPGEVRMPHHPTMLENGNILIFDNGWERKFSRVVEISPTTGRVVWELRSAPPEDFFSLKRGGNQRLLNGNTLITESDRGRVFEVTPAGRIVWEFYSTEVRGNKRKAIYRMERIVGSSDYPFLNEMYRRGQLK